MLNHVPRPLKGLDVKADFPHVLVAGLILMAAAVGAQAATVRINYTANLAEPDRGATAILGVAESLTSELKPHAQYGHTEYINDSDRSTREQTWNSFDTSNRETWHPYDYVGILWDKPQDNVAAIKITFATFHDGGWFATADNNDPAYNNDRYDDVACYPQVQYTTDGGVTWENVEHQKDTYSSLARRMKLDGPNGAPHGPIIFKFDPVSGINGIRLIGDGFDGNCGADRNGFLGVFEFEVYTARLQKDAAGDDNGASAEEGETPAENQQPEEPKAQETK